MAAYGVGGGQVQDGFVQDRLRGNQSEQPSQVLEQKVAAIFVLDLSSFSDSEYASLPLSNRRSTSYNFGCCSLKTEPRTPIFFNKRCIHLRVLPSHCNSPPLAAECRASTPTRHRGRPSAEHHMSASFGRTKRSIIEPRRGSSVELVCSAD
jgi:hypothetical protein